jgi:hypothetical protein
VQPRLLGGHAVKPLDCPGWNEAASTDPISAFMFGDHRRGAGCLPIWRREPAAKREKPHE